MPARVTRPGGLLVSLDFFLPSNPILRIIYLSYLYAQGAFWGLLLHGRPRSFTRAVSNAVPATSGVLIQFPFYGGIFGGTP